MMACTSPAWTRSVTPRRISFPSAVAWRSVISSRGLPNGPLQADAQEVLGLHGELHRQLLEDFLAESVDDHGDGVLGGETPLLAVEDLILADLRRGRLVLHDRRAVAHVDVGERVGAALVPDQHRVALGVVPRALGALQDLHETAIGVLPATGGNPF